MELIADILLVTGALAAGFYCFVLSRRLARFTTLESGVGGAVAVLSAQVDDLTRTLESAREAAGHSTGSLESATDRAEQAARRLELLMASMHDMPGDEADTRPLPRNGRTVAQGEHAASAPIFRPRREARR